MILETDAERLVPMDALTEGVQEGCKFTRKFSLCVRVGAGLALELRVDPTGSHRDEVSHLSHHDRMSYRYLTSQR